MPDESAPHQRTWMAFVAKPSIWGRQLAPQVLDDLASIANAIAEFEPVSILVAPENANLARRTLSSSITQIEHPLDDLWMRDTGPTFVKSNDGRLGYIDFNFNGWGNKQSHRKDREVASFIGEHAGATRLETTLVLEGGGFEINGEGDAILTESCTLNPNRNPDVDKAQFEAELARLLGIKRFTWLPGIAGTDITDGHIDFYARFCDHDTALCSIESDQSLSDYDITRDNLARLSTRYKTVTVNTPTEFDTNEISDDFAAGYIGYYICNGAVICQAFGDRKADQKAQAILRQQFANREIVPLRVDGIAAGGGSIHCSTQQQPV